MTFVDTGVMVGASLETHSRHKDCLTALNEAIAPFTNAHALAEIFSTLSGFYKVRVDIASELVLGISDAVDVQPLSLEDYTTAIREARRRGVMGGGIYDSLHATFARRHKAMCILTLNPSDFQHVAPEVEIIIP
jgi:predicted nucleic acid-binding protein